jgi:hypothetical protein
MGTEIREEICAQYIWEIENDGYWYHKVKHVTDFNTFRRITGNYISAIQKSEGAIRLTLIEWAYIVFHLWTVSLTHDPYKCANDTGRFRDEYIRLLMQHDPGIIGITNELRSINPKDTSNQGLAYQPREKEQLFQMFEHGTPIPEIAKSAKRTTWAIISQLINTGYLEEKGPCLVRKTPIEKWTESEITEIKTPSKAERITAMTQSALHQITNNLKWASDDMTDAVAYAFAALNSTSPTQTISKEQTMSIVTINVDNTIAIDTKTVIFGQDASIMSDAQIIDAIKRVEAQIAALKEVKTTSKKIGKNIKELEKQLDVIVAVFDKRS